MKKKSANPMLLFAAQLLPLLVFIVVDSIVEDVRISIVSAIVFAAGQMGFIYYLKRRIEWLVLVDVGLIAALGGVSIAFDNDLFFKVKPAIIEGLAVALFFGLLLAPRRFRKRYFERMMPQMNLSDQTLDRMKPMLGLLCGCTAVHIGAVLYTAYHSSREVWAFVSGPGFYLTLLPMGLYVIILRIRAKALGQEGKLNK